MSTIFSKIVPKRCAPNFFGVWNWTEKQKMVLNQKKTKAIIFESIDKYKFTTNLNLNYENLEIVKQGTLLGAIKRDDLKWDKNTE